MATEILRPNGAGDETSLNYCNPDTGEAHWEDVDEAVADDDATFVGNSQGGAYQRDLYALPAHSTGSGTINFIKIYFRCSKYTGYLGGQGAKPSLKSDSTVTDGTEVDPPEYPDWATFSQQWNTNPADSAAWEWADIDALQIGVSLNAALFDEAYCTQVYVEIDYTAITEKTSSDTGSGVDAKVTGNPLVALVKTDTGSGADAILAGNPKATLTPAGDIGSGADALVSLAAALVADETGTGLDETVSLEEFYEKISADTGLGVDTVVALLAGLTANDSGVGVDVVIGLTTGVEFIPRRTAYDGYRCFIEQYVKNKRQGTSPWKLPDGTKW